jgi:hypothetical protein
MNRKPDIIRTVAIIFVVGLVITGFTSMTASDSRVPLGASAYVSEAAPAAQGSRD